MVVVMDNLQEEDIVDLTDTASSSTAPHHFRDDPLLPIYSSGKDRPFSSKVVAEEIMNGVSTHLISSLVPHQPDENIAFMIGTQYLDHWKDVLSDNLGSWKNDAKKTLHYSTSHKVSKQIKLNPSSEERANVIVNRYLYVYPKMPSFKGIVVTASSRVNNALSGMEQWELKSPVFVQYYFADGRKPIVDDDDLDR